MSDSKLVRTINALNGDQFNTPAGRIEGAKFYFTGVNSGTAGDFSDLGDVVITRNDRMRVNVGMEDLADIDDIKFGGTLLDSTGSGAFEAQTFVPFFESGPNDRPFNNALAIMTNQELNIEWIPNSEASNTFSSLTLQVFIVLGAYEEKYETFMLQDNISEDGAVSNKPYQMNRENITALYLKDPGDVITNVALENKSRTLYSPQPFGTLLGDTLRNNRLEASTFDTIELQTFSRGNPASTINRGTELLLTLSGSGDVPVVKTGIIWPREQG